LPFAPAVSDHYRMTVDEFERIENSLKARRVELIDGLLIEKGDMDEAHAITDQRLGSRLNRLMPKGSMSALTSLYEYTPLIGRIRISRGLRNPV
jgi:Uma2 family endonuclease